MRVLFKISILLGLLLSSLFAEINEYKSDLYYANGIMINVSEKVATKTWDTKVKELFLDKQENYNKLEIIKVSYNKSQGFFDDLFESLEQKISNEFGWRELSAYVTVFLTTHNIQEDWYVHINDLKKQVASYKQSIKDGHGVIVIAHSQGNYFTNEAYEKLDDWMKEYFHMFGVATPANHVAGFAAGDTTAPYVKFHNDFIGLVIGGLDSNREDTHHGGFPNIPAHDFYESYMMDETTKQDIANFIETKIQEQVGSQSQWATDKESGENTKDYRITVKHMYDADIVMSEEVYPFAPNKKLYQVKDTAGIPHYVKASFGGEKILDVEVDADIWEAKDNQYYKLAGTDPVEYIEGEKTCKDPSLFEISSQENENTADWRVTVKNKETNETTEGVYPFNLKGSLYKLENSGDWVLASCGGTDILSVWDEQKENEQFKLENTEDIIKISLDRFIRDNDKDIVLDTKTKKMWQDDIEAKTTYKPWYTFDKAQSCIQNYTSTVPESCYDTSGDTAATYCKNLSLGGYSDWKLPSIEEFKAISTDILAVNNIFQNIGNAYYSTTTSIDYWGNGYADASEGIGMSFLDGTETKFLKESSGATRCVRDE